MDLKPLSPELNELRNIIISSNLTTCYLILEEVASAKSESFYFEKFRTQWINIFKNIYNQISKMKTRNLTRE